MFSDGYRRRLNKLNNIKMTRRKLFMEGKTPIYYDRPGEPIIVTLENEEYYFNSSKEAKEKLHISKNKLQTMKRPALKETQDDFNFNCETGLYWRCKNES